MKNVRLTVNYPYIVIASAVVIGVLWLAPAILNGLSDANTSPFSTCVIIGLWMLFGWFMMREVHNELKNIRARARGLVVKQRVYYQNQMRRALRRLNDAETKYKALIDEESGGGKMRVVKIGDLISGEQKL